METKENQGDIKAPSDEEIYELAHRVVRRATQAKLRIGTAESCTGGLVAGALTSVPGSSEALVGGIVSYLASIKHRLLNVESSIIDDPALGVVSDACASEMAQGAALLLDCDIAVSVTGIAGPGGEEPGKPVGTVWFGIHGLAGTDTRLHLFTGDRRTVRRKAVVIALSLLEGALKSAQ